MAASIHSNKACCLLPFVSALGAMGEKCCVRAQLVALVIGPSLTAAEPLFRWCQICAHVNFSTKYFA